LFQLRLQHIPLAKHLYRLNKAPSPTCPCCGLTDETVGHYLHFCPAHQAARTRLYAASPLARYNKHLLNSRKLLPALFAYIQDSGRFHAVYGDFEKVELPDDANDTR
ncbi:hypothetical protein DFH09DRAFT_913146, partial [Mycena vulgaris]